MAYESGAIDATLAAAVGDEPALIAELRTAFLDSVRSSVDMMRSSRGAEDWAGAALRLQSLAGSFGAVQLMALAEEAVRRSSQDGVLLRRIERAVERL
ncbi:Hpt domain-containing protein [Sphingomonas pokkalii]|uniref:Hpt domain-containing protein n=1 Tax=Sphingomonas pokkalii TaxID=2175090 RepID=A0A2U0SFT3_9SPHN|nr:Hpt domain-containing protein [Sphingomonas pokkalii]PVX30135.1 Hpt domain-containing protein [Sphingomonas pokkalii]